MNETNTADDSTEASFHLKGEYTWACNCDVVCPCTFGRPNTRDNCQFPMAYDIEEGHYGDVDLGGLNLVWMNLEGRRPMIKTFMDGEAEGAIYVDDSATPDQRDALVRVFTIIRGPHYRRIHAPRSVPIEYTREGNERTVVIPDVLDLTIQPVEFDGGTMKIFNAPFWTPEFIVSKALNHTYRDESLGYEWDFEGLYGDFGSFEWNDDMDLYRELLRRWEQRDPLSGSPD